MQTAMQQLRSLVPARPNVAALSAYPLGEREVPGVSNVINLASNESAVGPSEKVLAAIGAACRDLNRYPEASAATLREAIGRHHGLRPERIVCANGSSELISLIANAFLTPADQVIVSTTGYLFFTSAARIAGAEVIPVDATNLTFDVEAVLAAVTSHTKVVFLDNPNNPAGTTLNREAVRSLRCRLRSDILLVIDAAYAEYVTESDYDPGASLVDEFSNCIMLRTFSKIHGLAGLRVGWAYAPLDIADLLHRIRQPNNLNAPAIAGALAALNDPDRVKQFRVTIDNTRESFSRSLRSLGLAVPASQGNFVLATFNASQSLSSAEVYKRLLAKGIIVRPLHPYGLPDSLRITLGTKAQMQTVSAALEELLSTPAEA